MRSSLASRSATSGSLSPRDLLRRTPSTPSLGIALATALLTLLGAACSTTATMRYQNYESEIREGFQAGALGVGDLVSVRVYLHDDLNGSYEVSPQGTISFPLIGELACEGLTPNALAARIRDGLASGYVRDPQVIVAVAGRNSKKVYVLGRVAKPGRFPYTDGMTIIEAITLAGGFSPLAETNYTIVTRNDKRIPLPVEKIMQGLAANFFLQPGDIVYVPQSLM